MIDIEDYKSVPIELRDQKLEVETSNHVLDVMMEVLQELEAERAKVDELRKELDKYTVPRPIQDIHEDYGYVLCWKLPVEYYPDIKSCLDLSFNEDDYTHFTLIPNIKDPIDGK